MSTVVVRDIGPGAFVAGNDHEIDATDTNIPDTGQAAVTAWFTVKERIDDDDSEVILEKEITTVDVSNVGWISNDGSDGQDVTMRFDLLPADTILLMASHMGQVYFYDVKIETDSGRKYTSSTGTIVGDDPVRRA